MDDLATRHFKKDFIIMTLVHQEQFEQWFKLLFYLNDRLQKEFDPIYQDSFYVKIYEALTTGFEYAQTVHDTLSKGEKLEWYKKLIEGLITIKKVLNESEYMYLEYRRHSTSHIFQTQYEYIQKDFRIKKERNKQSLVEINSKLENLILMHGSDRKLDDYLNNKLQPILTQIYEGLTK